MNTMQTAELLVVLLQAICSWGMAGSWIAFTVRHRPEWTVRHPLAAVLVAAFLFLAAPLWIPLAVWTLLIWNFWQLPCSDSSCSHCYRPRRRIRIYPTNSGRPGTPASSARDS